MRPVSTATQYPNFIDDRLLYCDPNISQMPIVQQFNDFIAAEDYDSANNIIQTINVDYMGSYVVNILENRLYAMDRYFMNMDGDGRTKRHLQCYQTAEPIDTEIASLPTDNNKFYNWISD